MMIVNDLFEPSTWNMTCHVIIWIHYCAALGPRLSSEKWRMSVTLRSDSRVTNNQSTWYMKTSTPLGVLGPLTHWWNYYMKLSEDQLGKFRALHVFRGVPLMTGYNTVTNVRTLFQTSYIVRWDRWPTSHRFVPFGCGLVVNSAPIGQSGLGPHTKVHSTNITPTEVHDTMNGFAEKEPHGKILRCWHLLDITTSNWRLEQVCFPSFPAIPCVSYSSIIVSGILLDPTRMLKRIPICSQSGATRGWVGANWEFTTDWIRLICSYDPITRRCHPL
jgi:hypothetical protein